MNPRTTNPSYSSIWKCAMYFPMILNAVIFAMGILAVICFAILDGTQTLSRLYEQAAANNFMGFRAFGAVEFIIFAVGFLHGTDLYFDPPQPGDM